MDRHSRGLVRNEDNFSVQLQSEDGSFHLLLKSELQKMEYQLQPLMPQTMPKGSARQELDDLVGYLQSVSSTKEHLQGRKKINHEPHILAERVVKIMRCKSRFLLLAFIVFALR